jgi:hypothetical protein
MSADLKFEATGMFTAISKFRCVVQRIAHRSGRIPLDAAPSEATKPTLSVKSQTGRGNPHEVEMRTIDEIVAATLKTTEASLREAFEAGRAHTASALKARMAAFFEGLISEAEGKVAAATGTTHSEPPPHAEPPHHPEPHTEPPPSEPQHAEHTPEGHHA